MASNLSTKKKPDPAQDTEGERPVASVQRALLVMNAFLNEEVTLTLAELVDRTGLDRAVIGRIVGTLEQKGYVVTTPSGEFHIGAKPLLLANRFHKTVQPADIVIPVLRELVEKTLETASYIIPQKEMRISLYRVPSPQAIRDHGVAGDMMPLSQGAAGHVFTAFRDGEDSPRRSSIRMRMVAVSNGEIHPGMTGMASPVFASDRQCIGAVGLTGPTTRFTPAAMAQWEPELLRAAKLLTQRLGGDGAAFERPIPGLP